MRGGIDEPQEQGESPEKVTGPPSTDPARPYTVGYGKPPVTGRFQKGRSGNPKGRPKARKDLPYLIAKYGQKTMQVQIQGQEHTLTLDQVITLQLHADAMEGSAPAADLFFKFQKLADTENQPVEHRDNMVLMSADALDEWRRLEDLAKAERNGDQ